MTVRKWILVLMLIAVVFGACSDFGKQDPIPDIKVVNNLSVDILLRGDLLPSDYAGDGFESYAPVESPLWKFAVKARSSQSLAIFPKAPGFPKTTNGIFRVMVITEKGEPLLNRTFTSSEFEKTDWSLYFE